MARYTLSNCPLSHLPLSKRGVRIDLLNSLFYERASIGTKTRSNSGRLLTFYKQGVSAYSRVACGKLIVNFTHASHIFSLRYNANMEIIFL